MSQPLLLYISDFCPHGLVMLSKWITHMKQISEVLQFWISCHSLPQSAHLRHTPTINLSHSWLNSGTDYSKTKYRFAVQQPTTSTMEVRWWFHGNPTHKRWLFYNDCYSLEPLINIVKTSCNCFLSHSVLYLEGNGLFIRIRAWGISAG